MKKLKATINVELNACAESSREDIKKGKVRSYEDFSKEVKQWLISRPNILKS
ncbi:MAG TPA: hypothetical protein PLP27_02055 [Crocinitomicaceae bacterium]|nr:hypothetical protein [Crocinitomicaceae bacterium]